MGKPVTVSCWSRWGECEGSVELPAGLGDPDAICVWGRVFVRDPQTAGRYIEACTYVVPVEEPAASSAGR